YYFSCSVLKLVAEMWMMHYFPTRRSSDVGDRFVIGSLTAIVALIGIFIVWPSIAIFIPMFTNDAGEFAPLAFMTVLSQAHIIQRSEEHTSELQSRENLLCRLHDVK